MYSRNNILSFYLIKGNFLNDAFKIYYFILLKYSTNNLKAYFFLQLHKLINLINLMHVKIFLHLFHLQADWNQILLQSEDFIKASMAAATKDKKPIFSKL